MFTKVKAGMQLAQAACRQFAQEHKTALKRAGISAVALGALLGYMYFNHLSFIGLGSQISSGCTLLGNKISTIFTNMTPAGVARVTLPPLVGLGAGLSVYKCLKQRKKINILMANHPTFSPTQSSHSTKASASSPADQE